MHFTLLSFVAIGSLAFFSPLPSASAANPINPQAGKKPIARSEDDHPSTLVRKPVLGTQTQFTSEQRRAKYIANRSTPHPSESKLPVLKVKRGPVLPPQKSQKLEEIISDTRKFTLREQFDKAKVNQPLINNLVTEIAGATAANPMTAQVKSEQRVMEKLHENRGTVLKDLARGAIIVDSPDQGEQVARMLMAKYPCHDRGWRRLQSNYFDRKFIVRLPNGGVAEVQIVPKAIAEYKFNEGHRLYEISRNENKSPSERAAADAKMKEDHKHLIGKDSVWSPFFHSDDVQANDAEWEDSEFDEAFESLDDAYDFDGWNHPQIANSQHLEALREFSPLEHFNKQNAKSIEINIELD
jgi:hypothetical protein